MEETKNASSFSEVPNLTGRSIVVTDTNGTLSKISETNVVKTIKNSTCIGAAASLSARGGDWIRVARTRAASTFSAIINITHEWSSGRPIPLLALAHGSGGRAEGCNIHKLTSGVLYQIGTTNQYASFPRARITVENSYAFVEVQLREGKPTHIMYCSLAAPINIELIQPEVAPASGFTVLREFDLSN